MRTGQPARKAHCGPQGAWNSPRRTAWKRSHALVVLPVAHPAAQHWKEALWRCSHPVEGRSGRDPSAETFPRSALRTASFVRASLLVSSEVPDVQRPSGAGVFRRRPRWSAAAAHGRSRRTAPAGHRLPEKGRRRQTGATRRDQSLAQQRDHDRGPGPESATRVVPHLQGSRGETLQRAGQPPGSLSTRSDTATAVIEEQPRSPTLMNGGQSVSPRVPDPRSQVAVSCASAAEVRLGYGASSWPTLGGNAVKSTRWSPPVKVGGCTTE